MIKFFIQKGVVTISLNIAILMVGYFSLGDIANEFIPAVEIPAVGVVFPTTILSHDNIENSFIKKMERKLLATGDVEKIEVTLDRDQTILFIFYKWSLTPEESLQRARQTVTSVPRPIGVLDPIFVLHRPSMSPIYRVVFHGQTSGELTRRLEEFSSKVERLPGVAEVKLQGASPEIGSVEVSPYKAASFGVNTSDIIYSAKKKWGFKMFWENSSESKGVPKKNQILRMNISGIEDFKSLAVYSNNRKKKVPLRWISQLKKQDQPASVFFGDKKHAVVLEVLKAPGTDAIQIVDTVRNNLDQLILSNPGLKFTEVYNEAQKIKEAQAGVLKNFAVGVTLNSLVLVIFLGSLIGAIVASCVFPTAILGTLFVMKSCDISLNIFALNGFSLASGMITDASIVVLESIMRRFQKGESLFNSSFRGTKDVMLGVFASTLTTAAVIVPISIQSGVSSKLFSDLGIVLVTTQFISLIAVFTFVPWICSKILSNDDSRPKIIEVLYQGSDFLVNQMNSLSSAVLRMSINRKDLRWGLPIVVTTLSIIMLMALPESEFLPKVAAKTYALSIPYDRSELAYKGDQLVKKLSHTLGTLDIVDWVVTSKDNDSLTATFYSNRSEASEDVISKVSVAMGLNKNKVLVMPLGPAPSSEPMNYDGYYYFNKNLGQANIAKISDQFCKNSGIMDCTSGEHYRETKFMMQPNASRMALAETNILSTTLNVAALTQKIDLAALAGLSLDYPVLLKFDFSENVTDFPLPLGKNRDEIRSLGTLFDTSVMEGENARFRKNGQGYSPLFFRLDGITIGQAVSLMDELFTKNKFDKDKLEAMGTIETMDETFSKMIQALCLSAFLILLVLVIQFKSISQALIIMYSIPLSVGGAVAGLLITGETLNVGVIVGFILLIGIIVNNGILLMDAINQRRTSGMELLPAVLEAVESRTRPILMTTFSTILGMLPTLLLDAEGKELYQGMAIVNIFGMAFGTLLTLVVIPILIRSVLAMSSKKEEVII